jgi:hypothetical protein
MIQFLAAINLGALALLLQVLIELRRLPSIPGDEACR